MAFVILKVYTQSINLVISNELFHFILLFLKKTSTVLRFSREYQFHDISIFHLMFIYTVWYSRGNERITHSLNKQLETNWRVSG